MADIQKTSSPDAGPDDTQVPALPPGWIAQWDSESVPLPPSPFLSSGHHTCAVAPRAKRRLPWLTLDATPQLAEILLRPDLDGDFDLGPPVVCCAGRDPFHE